MRKLFVYDEFDERYRAVSRDKVLRYENMLNVGSDSKPHWVSKQVWEIIMNVSEKYYPKTKKD